MKRKFLILGIIVIVFANLFSISVFGSTNYPVRFINVVYDDSGSMIKTHGASVDTWCQAKYSLEVFAALLGENDTMNVYYMSDYEADTSASPKLTLYGKDGSEQNVNKVHSMVTEARNTKFNTVRKAYSDLVSASADEKWLVVLTDGQFQPESTDVNDFFDKKESGINVMFLGMGADAQAITENSSKNIYFEKAETSTDILNKITNICTRIFNSNKLYVNPKSKEVSFDVPMSELVIFAQGGDVDVGGLTDKNGNYLKGEGKPVKVKYSETAALNEDKYPSSGWKIDKDLLGKILTYRGDFDAGTYGIDVSGAETIEIYYKPNVSVGAYLYDMDGRLIEQGQAIEAGEYTVEFGLVRTGTNERVPESELLGEIIYSAEVEQNGVSNGGAITSGDKITLTDGRLDIDVVARYLKYNTVNTHLDFTIYSNKVFELETIDQPVYVLEGEGISNADEPVTVKIKKDDGNLTDEEWANINTFEAAFQNSRYSDGFDFIAVKDQEPGVFKLYPKIKTAGLSDEEYASAGLQLSLAETVGNESWNGKSSCDVTFIDNRFKKISFSVENSEPYVVTTAGITPDDRPMIIKTSIEGEEWTPERWQGMQELKVESFTETGGQFSYTAQKTDQPGIYYVYPKIDGELDPQLYQNERIRISAEGSYGIERWAGETETDVRLTDERSWFERYRNRIIKLTILGLILLLILGYIPPFKKYLPKDLKKRPTITRKIDRKQQTPVKGSLEKDLASKLIPYKAEQGTIKFMPKGAEAGVPRLKVKAMGGKRMELLNTADFAKHPGVTIGGAPVLAGQKNKTISSGTVVEYLSKDKKTFNSCTLKS